MTPPELCPRTLDRGTQSGVRERATAIARSEDEWAAIWARHAAKVLPAPPRPRVDFAREMVLAVFLGERPTGGHAVEVEVARRDGDALAVTARVSRPAAGALVTQALTAPHHIVALPRWDGRVDVRFRDP